MECDVLILQPGGGGGCRNWEWCASEEGWGGRGRGTDWEWSVMC